MNIFGSHFSMYVFSFFFFFGSIGVLTQDLMVARQAF
jgi:hypothetical protein